MAMQDILRQVTTLPGIAGALIYNRGSEILASEFPGIYEPSTLQRAVSLLSEDLVILQEMVGDSGAMDLKYTGGRLIVKPCAGGSILVLCTAAINSQLLSLALTQATRRLEKAPAIPPSPMKAPAPALPPETMEPLKRAFRERVGPIGDMLFARIYENWAASDPAAKRGLEGLMALLAREIDDQDDRLQFMNEARISLA